MIHRIEVGPKDHDHDPRGRAAAAQGRAFLKLPIDAISTRAVYKISVSLTEDEVEQIRLALTDPVIEVSSRGRLRAPEHHWVIRVGFRPGVTDNVGRTARVFLCDLLHRSAAQLPPEQRVFTETLYYVKGGALDRGAITRLAHELLANVLIERVQIWSATEYRQDDLDLDVPKAGSASRPRAEAIPLPDDDQGLQELSRARHLALSLAEMKAIRAHYAHEQTRSRRLAVGLPSGPTDVEIEALAQTWSEHCKHKIFNAQIDYRDEESGERRSIRSLFRTYIVDATEDIAQRVDWLVSVFDDNAGVISLDPETNLVYKVETHNSPSALDPYGGAMTGIVGVNRDPFGTGMGAALLTNVWGYCLGSPEHRAPLPEGLLHPRRIRQGVHQGVVDGGNQSGIPYSRGWEIFDERFIGKPLVFCGTVGVMPKTLHGAPSHEKTIVVGDVAVMVGGRIGKDGIHGATFSSEALHGESPAQAVQIGDPITQKMMTDMLLEARDRGLYRAITDNGAGGLSSSMGEIAELSGGVELDLDRAPLKYAGLMPWEILLSEAQERMTLAVPPEKVEALIELAARREVEVTAIGRFTDSGFFCVRYQGEVVGELPMRFLHGGCPRLELSAHWRAPRTPTAALTDAACEQKAGQYLLDMSERLNLCSKEHTARRYDHEVKGLSVIKPLVGVFGDVASDATVMRVDYEKPHAILLSEGIAPRLSDIDAGLMGAYVVDLAVRRIIAGGGKLGQIAGLDNFCWPDPVQSAQTPDGEQKLAALVRCCAALSEHVRALDLPLISGKDSMKNDSMRGGVKISIPPTLLFSVLGWIPDASAALDLTLPTGAQHLYVVGETADELGGSEFAAMIGERAGRALNAGKGPESAASRTIATCRAVQAAIDRGLVSACHAPHLGGLALGLATLCLAADRGLRVDLGASPRRGDPSTLALLFAESSARLLVAVADEKRVAFEATLAEHAGAVWGDLGQATDDGHLTVVDGERPLFDVEVKALRARYRERLT